MGFEVKVQARLWGRPQTVGTLAISPWFASGLRPSRLLPAEQGITLSVKVNIP